MTVGISQNSHISEYLYFRFNHWTSPYFVRATDSTPVKLRYLAKTCKVGGFELFFGHSP
jgi:hypothetical protein